MDEKFISIIEKVIYDRGRITVNNLAVFNSLLADYARGEFMRERRLFIRELRTASFDEVMKKYRELLPKPASPQPVSNPPVPVPSAPPVSGNNSVSSSDDDNVYHELEKRDRHIEKGFKCLEEDNDEKAARHFSKAMAILPNGDAYFGLACCSSRAGDYTEAIDLLDEAEELYEEEGDRRGIRGCNRAISNIKDKIKQEKEDKLNKEALIKLGIDIISELLS